VFDTVVQKTHRVPRFPDGTPAGDGSAVARQLDAALLGVGFTASRELMEHVGGLEPGAAFDLAVAVVRAVRPLVGDHVQHNAYFLHFPRGVPDTIDFWVGRVRSALLVATGAAIVEEVDEVAHALLVGGQVNLLDLPGYGRYQHTYADLLAAHDDLIAAAGDRVTVLHLGGTLAEETARLFRALAGSTVPLGEDDAALLARLAADPTAPDPPGVVPVRETRALINAARLVQGRPLVGVDTTTDVLRVLVALNDGDLTLAAPTRFGRVPRPHRRALLTALHQVVTANLGKLGDVPRYAEVWKRLGRVLHPRAFPALTGAHAVFNVASGAGGLWARSLTSQFEEAARGGRPIRAAFLSAAAAPGLLVRQADRLLRTADPADVPSVLTAVTSALPEVSGRVLLSLREHVQNRATPAPSRIFVGRTRRAWATDDTRPPLPAWVTADLTAAVNAEIIRRLPHDVGHLVVDPAVRDVALPLSGRATEAGFAVLPRGSRTRIDPGADTVRLFTYWQQAAVRTDYDLSAALLTADFVRAGHVSWTSYHDTGGAVTYSGDLTEAAAGATEFIDVRLDRLPRGVAVLLPQVHIYSGEDFTEAAESMFGWMVRHSAQAGVPFEARTVRTRSDMRGAGRVALPMALVRDGAGWAVVWTHLYLRGYPAFNAVENNRATAEVLARAILARRYLTVGDLVDLWSARAATVTDTVPAEAGPVTYVGLDRPDGLPAGSQVYTLGQLAELIPA